MTFFAGRVTNRTINDHAYSAVQGNAARLSAARDRVSTGKAHARPSESVNDTATAMRARNDLAEVQRWQRSGEDGVARLNTIDASFTSIADQLSRVQELAVTANNSVNGDPATLEAIAKEIETLRTGILADTNQQYLGRPVFGGTINGANAYDTTGTFVGNNAPLLRAIGPNQKLDVGIDAEAVFGPTGDNIFDHLQDLADAIRVGDTTALANASAVLKDNVKAIDIARADVGSRTNVIETAMRRAADSEIRITDNVSKAEDVDMAKAILDLNVAEASFKSSLAGAARTIQPSLLDFLR